MLSGGESRDFDDRRLYLVEAGEDDEEGKVSGVATLALMTFWVLR